MLDRKKLLSDLQTLLRKEIEPDLRQRSELPEIERELKAEFEKAKKAKRTALNYTDWRSDYITQIGVAWVLSCVFIRFLEDNRLVDPPRLSGPTGVVSGQSSVFSEEIDNRQLKTENSLQRARDERDIYVQANPEHSFRQYILSVVDDLATLSGGKEVFGKNNLIHQQRGWLSNDAGKALYNFWQKIEPATGKLIHDFTDDAPAGQPFDTRFLGDLYQDLSEAARKKYALLQTPDFVEEFILDRTLEPALDEFGLVVSSQTSETDNRQLKTENYFRMIDPACGSGHFLLGAFDRILSRWQRKEPGTKVDKLVERTLASIHGVDINPFAVAIARFRLLLAAFRACHVERLDQPIDFHLNVACGDSLYHGRQRQLMLAGIESDESHYFRTENVDELKRILVEGRYHAVVANPPYIVPKDRAANQAYRDLYSKSCHMKYSLSVPFMERIFQLATPGQFSLETKDHELRTKGQGSIPSDIRGTEAGYTGQITANSFMKREFGKKLIESFFPTMDLTHVIDTSGAYIPGHGTPTTILFGRNRLPVQSTIRTVMGIKGEPATPNNPAEGLVWTAIVDQVDQPGSESDFVSAGDSERARFGTHPWSIGGGGAAELKEEIEENCQSILKDLSDELGIASVTGEDEFFVQSKQVVARYKAELTRPLVVGDVLRDWVYEGCEIAFWTYNDSLTVVEPHTIPNLVRKMWCYRAWLARRKRFGTPMIERGFKWYEWQELYPNKFKVPLTLTYAEVATHNHFVLDRGGKVFKQTAPVIKLPADIESEDGSRRPVTEDDHLALLGLLNSSTACFWMKQVAHNKGDRTDQHGARTTGDAAFDTYAFNATLIKQLPLPADRPLEIARRLDALSQQLAAVHPTSMFVNTTNVFHGLEIARTTAVRIRSEMVRLQEDLDWQCYQLYGLIDDELFDPAGVTAISRGSSTATPPGSDATTHADPAGVTAADAATPPGSNDLSSHANPGCAARPGANSSNPFGMKSIGIYKGQRAFEIVLARKMAADDLQTTWFERHGITPITEIPEHWSDDYKALVQKRIDVIESNPNIALIEQPEYKRRWNTEPWDSQVQRALKSCLLDRLESYFDFDGRMQDVVSGQSAVVSEEKADAPELKTDDSQPKTDNCPLKTIAVYSVAKLADVAAKDERFMEVAQVYRDRADFDVVKLVEELVAEEHLPALPILRYKPAGLDKRKEWEQTWELQRAEDRIHAQVQTACAGALTEEAQAKKASESPGDSGSYRIIVDKLDFAELSDIIITGHKASKPDDKSPESVAAVQQRIDHAVRGIAQPKISDVARLVTLEILGEIPVPPKYASADFISSGGARYWNLRGKLDVPKERWVSFPHCQGEDQTLPIAWAGYDHLQLTRGIAAYFAEVQERGGSQDPRLVPLLAAMDQQIPWVKQWHNDIDPDFGLRLGDYFENFINDEARNLNLTVEDIRKWIPPEKTKAKKRTAKSAKKASAETETD